MNLDKTINLHSTQQSPFKNRRNRLLAKEDTLNISPILNDTSLFRNLNDTSLRQALDETLVLPSQGSAGQSLSEAYFEIIQSSRNTDVLDTLARFSQACYDSLELVEPWKRYNEDNYWLADEANTWKLLQCLYADSTTVHLQTLDGVLPDLTLSQQKLVDALFESDSEIRLLQIIVDWLEASAAYQEDSTKTSAPVMTNNIHWSNTLHQLLIGSSLFNKEKNIAMITCMDPDAPRRQKKSIHSDDQLEDNDLCKRIFTEVRCGKFNNAISLCVTAGQPWRGAALQGWRLLHYLPREDANAPLEIAGNPSRDLWKWCCLGIANSPSENMHYKATIGILCGHLVSALPACHGNWEDLLWAHLKIQIEARVDKFLREHHATAHANTTPLDVLELLQSELLIQELSLKQVFSAVTALMDGKKESVYQTCQKHLILGHIRAIMKDAMFWVDNTNFRLIRFLAHLILLLRQMGKDPQHDVGDKILQKYVSQLINKESDGPVDCPELIAYYTSAVPVEAQIELYANLMNSINNIELRHGVIKAGTNAGIDVAASARMAIKKAISDIHQGYGNVDTTFTHTGSAEYDKSLIDKVISSLEWLSLIPNQIQEALWLNNTMIRTFIFIGNTDAAASCVTNLNKIFPVLMSKINPNSAELREHLCLKAYLEALDGFATWYRHYMSGQPKEIEPLPQDASFTDKVHHEQRCAQVEQQRARWANSILHQSRHTKSLLYNVLLFPGGWLQDETDNTSSPHFSDDEKLERSKQLQTLRRLCIPEVTILILKILQSNDDIENHKEALKLTTIIAAENRSLYKEFTKEKLKEIIEKVTESSLLLVEKGKDMFGFDLNSDE